jgi:HSP20 family protein
MRSLVPMRTRFPWAMTEFRRSMDNLLEEFFDGGTQLAEGFVPRADVAETENEYEVTVDLPGVKPEELTVEYKGNELWITGERKQEKEEKGKTFHRVEKRYGRFDRAITLASPVDEGKVSAEYHDGVLRVTVPKAEQARAKRIEVKAV